jgi:hypothetical protein
VTNSYIFMPLNLPTKGIFSSIISDSCDLIVNLLLGCYVQIPEVGPISGAKDKSLRDG